MEQDEKRDAVVTRAHRETRQLRGQVEGEQERARARNEPIAIVGMSCRFPGGSSDPESYWRLLCDGVDAVSEVPPGRWNTDAVYDPDPEALGKTYTRFGAFLRDIDLFDPVFFDISPREARGMDPQQRLLLEVSWEALERAGQAPDKLRGSRTGAFIGYGFDDFGRLIHSGDRRRIDAYNSLGTVRPMAAGRLAYLLGLRGPVLQVETSCSSSLAAVHLACQSLRERECDLALVGAVNLMLAPEPFIALSKVRALAPDGRCKAFDARANGYGRAEGCGVVVLKRLSEAVAKGDHILAVLRGSAINHDGRSNGLTAPSGPAQEQVIRMALERAEVAPHQVQYVETHGTGTSLGDPIEVLALNRVMGEGRAAENRLAIGSVKTNVGHLEAAAGMASLIKVVLAIQHGQIPPHLHLETLNPYVPWDNVPLDIPTRLTPWPAPPDGRRLAGVSSFGMSGTNVHLVVEEAPPPASKVLAAVERPLHLLSLSARDEAALAALVAKYAEFLKGHPEANPADLCFTANTGRSQFRCRRAVVGETARALGDRLVSSPRVVPTRTGRVAFLFTGQGGDLAGVGSQLYQTQPVFRRTLDRCDALLRPQLEVPLLEVIYGPSRQGSLLEQTAYAQPALFALQCALVELWRSWGVEPEMVMGHSVGEYAAAWTAGVFSLELGLQFVAGRAKVMQEKAIRGSMAMVMADEDQVTPLLQGLEGRLALAALNGPRNTVISGESTALEQVLETLRSKGVRSQRLAVSHAFHSPLIEPALSDLARLAGQVNFATPRLDLVSTLSGQLETEGLSVPDYWTRHARQPVCFAKGMQTLHQEGGQIFIEIGPQPVLLAMGQRCLPDGEGSWLPSLRAGRPEWEVILDSLSRLYEEGARIDWEGFDSEYVRRKVDLPTYPFQRQSYRVETPGSKQGIAPLHPLLDRMIRSPELNATLFETEFSVEAQPLLGEHRLYGDAVSPGACQISLALGAVNLLDSEKSDWILEDLMLPQALTVPAGQKRTVHALFNNAADQEFQVVSSIPGEDGKEGHERAVHLTGRWSAAADEKASRSTEDGMAVLSAWREVCAQPIAMEAFYAGLAAAQLELGASFRWLAEAWCSEAAPEVLARLVCPEAVADASNYAVHPGLLDACFQVAGLAESERGAVRLPFALAALQVHRQPQGNAWWCHAQQRSTQASNTEPAWDIELLDHQGALVLSISGLQMRAASAQSVRGRRHEEWLQTPAWSPSATAVQNRTLPSCWLLAGASVEFAARLKELAKVETLSSAADFTSITAQLEQIAAHHTSVGLVYQTAEVVEQDAPAAALASCSELLQLSQALLATTLEVRVFVVTQGTQCLVGDTAQPAVMAAGGSLWGLGRTLMQEEPRLNCVLVDLESNQPAAAQALLLAQELQAEQTSGAQVAWRRGKRYQASLQRYVATPHVSADGQPMRLRLSEYGSLDALRYVPMVRRQPGPGEIEVRVTAAGVNLRDLLNSLGVLRDYYAEKLGIQHPDEVGLGLECAGVVAAVGEGVTAFADGDRVMGVSGAEGAFAAYAYLPAHSATKIPAGLSDLKAAALPLAYLTAWYALVELAKLQAGERVLIHAAAGGVGQAAVQIAQLLGAEVIATASPGKWELLRQQGVTQVLNSRTLDFTGQVSALTDGHGADVVLNSLNGDFIPASFAALGRGGRFVEIGKVGAWGAEQAEQHRPDAAYFLFDLGEEIDRDRALGHRLWTSIVSHLETGKLRALPVTAFAAGEAVAALRTMQQAGHVGKLVVDFALPGPLAFPPEASYVVTGGLGGLGLQIAQELAAAGARQLVLAGRSVIRTEAQRALLSQLVSDGVRVKVVQADVSDAAAASALIDHAAALGPLRGIVHAAGVIDDGTLATQTPARFSGVMRPKADGAWHLHLLTQHLELDFFVAFSSIASLVGSPGQSNYAAASGFLDGLMQARRNQGMPGLSINWGPWAELGMAAQLGSQMQRQGIRLITPRQGRQIFRDLLSQPVAQVAVVSRLRRQEIAESRPPDLRLALAELEADQRATRMEDYLRQELAGVLGLQNGSTIGPRARFFDLGLDSLMTLELRNKLQKELDVKLHSTLLFDYPTLEVLTPHLLEELHLDAAPEVQPRSNGALAAAASPVHESIAIVGMGCRLPGGSETPDAFWHQLVRGLDAVHPLSAQRARDNRSRLGSQVPQGAFLDHVDGFDLAFFGVSPREGVVMDPAHRLLLETAWHALEDAGIVPAELVNHEVGVFIGGGTSGYLKLVEASEAGRGLYTATGNVPSTAAGRLSYFFGWTGPSMALDTACSSSLVAIHLACQSLLRGECSAAIAGGVSVIVGDDFTEMFANAGMLSRDARCKTFDADANGYVRGEGVGIVVLKRLADAQRDGDRILAVVRGSTINQDGASGGLTVPNGPSQERLVRRALAVAGVQPSEVGYIEAHGTGTQLGDPIEVRALGKVFAERGRPLYIGSVKTNVGHLEFAAGVTGLIKLVLSVQNGLIPPHMHLRTPSPQIDWASLPVEVPTVLTPWPAQLPRVGGVSSFGFSGTNAHVVVSAPPPESHAGKSAVEPSFHLLTVAAKDAAALAAYIRSHADFLADHPDVDLGDFTHTARVGRSHFHHRLSLVADSVQTLCRQLAQIATGEHADAAQQGIAGPTAPSIAWLFTGQGSQYAGMGKELYAACPAFRRLLEECDTLMRAEVNQSVLEIMHSTGKESAQRLDEEQYTQPALFVIEYALAMLWRSWGIHPHVLVGHGVGEVAAACVAGVFSLRDGLRLVAARGRLMAALSQGGISAEVRADEGRAERWATAYQEGFNSTAPFSMEARHRPIDAEGPGESDAIRGIGRRLAADGSELDRRSVSHALNPPLMESMLKAFGQVADSISYRQPVLRLISNVTGRLADDEIASAAYWVRHVGRPARFEESVSTLNEQGVKVFMEIGPGSTLIDRCFDARGVSAEAVALVPSLRSGQSELKQLLTSLGELFVRGVMIDWRGVDRDYLRRKISMPVYPFQHQRCWVDVAPRPVPLSPAVEKTYPLLGQRLSSPLEQLQFAAQLSAAVPAFLSDHRLRGVPVLPVSALVEMMLAASRHFTSSQALCIRDLEMLELLTLSESEFSTVQLVLTPQEGQSGTLQVSSRIAGAKEWVLHAKAKLHEDRAALAPLDVEHLRKSCSAEVAVADLYAWWRRQGLEYGPSFQVIDQLWRGENEVLARLVLPEHLCAGAADYLLHPVLLNACFQASAILLPAEEGPYLPVGIEQLEWRQSPQTCIWVHVRRLESSEKSWRADLSLFSSEGEVVLHAKGAAFRRATSQGITTESANSYEVSWQPALGTPEADPTKPGRWLILSDTLGAGQELADFLQKRGDSVTLASAGENYALLAADRYQVRAEATEDFDRLLGECAGAEGLKGVVQLWGLDSTFAPELTPQSLQAELALSCGGTMHLVQALGRQRISEVPRLWVVTRGAQPAGPVPIEIDAAQASLWGLGRTIALEYPALRCTLLDLDPEGGNPRSAWEEICADGKESQLAWRQSGRYVARLTQVREEERRLVVSREGRLSVQRDRTYLITGGLGALGIRVAQWLAELGAQHLVLCGRRGLGSDEVRQSIVHIEGQGVQVRVVQADVSVEADVRQVISLIKEGMPPLSGIIHAAGVLEDGVLQHQTWERFAKVLSPKVAGAWNLHVATHGQRLDFFVCFSSAVAIMGAAGQGNYAAANAFMDGLMHLRRAQALPGLAVNWGPWEGAGMASGFDQEERGVRALSPGSALQALKLALEAGLAQAAIFVAEWPRYLQNFAETPAFLAAFDEKGSSAPARVVQTLREELEREPNRQAVEERLRSYVRAQVARILEMPSSTQIGTGQRLFDLGLDSLMALELANSLRLSMGHALPATVIFDYPTVEALVGYLADLVLKAPPRDTAVAAGEAPDALAVYIEGLDELSESDVQKALRGK